MTNRERKKEIESLNVIASGLEMDCFELGAVSLEQLERRLEMIALTLQCGNPLCPTLCSGVCCEACNINRPPLPSDR